MRAAIAASDGVLLDELLANSAVLGMHDEHIVHASEVAAAMRARRVAAEKRLEAAMAVGPPSACPMAVGMDIAELCAALGDIEREGIDGSLLHAARQKMQQLEAARKVMEEEKAAEERALRERLAKEKAAADEAERRRKAEDLAERQRLADEKAALLQRVAAATSARSVAGLAAVLEDAAAARHPAAAWVWETGEAEILDSAVPPFPMM